MKPLISYLEVVEDPRDIRGKKYRFTDLLTMTIYGILNQEIDFANISFYLKLHEDYFKNLLNLDKTPSHDCLSDLFASIDPQKFFDQFILWIKDIVKDKSGMNISIDGKAVKSARDKINGGNTPYILSAFLSDIGISIGQIKMMKNQMR